METDKEKKLDYLTARIPASLKTEFQTALRTDRTGNATISTVIRSCVEAYLRLVKRANGRPLPALELCGYEDENGSNPVRFSRPPVRNAGRQGEYASTGKIEKVAKR